MKISDEVMIKLSSIIYKSCVDTGIFPDCGKSL